MLDKSTNEIIDAKHSKPDIWHNQTVKHQVHDISKPYLNVSQGRLSCMHNNSRLAQYNFTTYPLKHK